jgi:hypothetical protein
MPGLTTKVASELPVTYQWQSSDDANSWVDVVGQVGTGFDITQFNYVRCVATNGAGSTISNVCQFRQ